MAKSMAKDSQIILNMLQIQDSINEILDSQSTDDLVKSKVDIDLLTYYIVKMFALRKNFHSKTKKALSFFDDTKGSVVLSSLNYCYPMISNQEIVNLASELSNGVAHEELSLRYETCIKESEGYQGE